MLGYVCKYTPVEIFEAMGTDIHRIEPDVTGFPQAEAWMHANMCSYSKAVLEDIAAKDYDGIILTTCCDSIRRLYDTLKHHYPDKFIYLMDIPRKVTDFAVELYEKQLLEMIHSYAAFSGKNFTWKKLQEILKRKSAAEQLNDAPLSDHKIAVGLAGARPGNDLRNLLENNGAEIVFDLTCTGITRGFTIKDVDSEHQLLSQYAWNMLNQIPCMRMMDATNRSQFIDGMKDRIDGIIYHTIKFCDVYSYEYEMLRERGDIPLVLVETDATRQGSGQILTRTEAFLESLRAGKSEHSARTNPIEKHLTEDGHMYVLGIDSGSTSTNAVILDENKTIKAFSVIRTGAKSMDSADRILNDILGKADLERKDLSNIVSTGYGRVSISFADSNVTEISCHGKGAHYLNPDIRTILDIGGQDSKAIRLNENGDVTDFVMNDKCAAGTGRFLEMMARTLEISTAELGPVSKDWKENIEISSMCSVFAESEVISLIAQNKEKADIAHGIHNAIAGKAISLLKRVGIEGVCMMTGGVAKNSGVVRSLEEKLGTKLYISEEPEIVGALGAALFALENLEK